MQEIKSKFERREVKYLIDEKQRRAIMELIAQYMKPDEFGRSTICNVYYDTPDMLLVRRSLEKPLYKEKLRVRSYGTAAEDGKVFVVEYKGKVYVTNDDSQEKCNLGELWEEKSNGKALFLMAEKQDSKGRDVYRQLADKVLEK